MKRRSLSPLDPDPCDVHATRRSSGGARRDLSDRVSLRGPDGELAGWTLNISRGGIRVLLEDRIELGQEFDVMLGSEGESATPRRGRIVWIQEESDGTICGVEFLDQAGSTDDDDEPPRSP